MARVTKAHVLLRAYQSKTNSAPLVKKGLAAEGGSLGPLHFG
jgi:hypothetical protein